MNSALLSKIFSTIFIGMLIAVAGQGNAAEREGMGLPECQLIVGVDRYITIGDTVSHTIDYMESNKYRCDDFKGNANEIVSCTYSIDFAFEVLLIVESGIVKDIETFYSGAECSYFNIKPFVPPEKNVN